ncbi:MAG: hypothetical protein QXD03_05360 [Candidatus Anstonellales archaeon]
MNLVLEVYNDLREELRNNLEARYQHCIFIKDYAGAYEILGKLMEYRLIDRSDSRLTKEYHSKIFRKAKISSKHRFKYDLRDVDNCDYMPKWVIRDIPENFSTSLVTRKKAVKISEKSHESYTIQQPRNIKIGFKLVVKSKLAIDSIKDICNIYYNETGKVLQGINIDEFTCGCSRIYTIDIESPIISQYKRLGYVIVGVYSSGIIYVNVIIRTDVLNYLLIDIKKACNVISLALESNLGLQGKYNISYMVDYSKAIEIQNQLLNENNMLMQEIERMKSIG